MQFALPRCELWLQVANWGAMIWQFMQVSGSSERYDQALDVLKVKRANPTKIPSMMITGNRH